MNEQGVPVDEVTSKDFIMVRAALVRRLGGANEALVWSRIFYRCDEDSRAAHETEAGRWWAATYSAVGSETGLTPKQARGALDSLVAGGFLRREQHALRNNYDQTYSYQPVVAEGQLHVPSGADRGGETGNSGLPSGAIVPTSKRPRDRSTENVASAPTLGMKFAQPLCDVLIAQLVANGVKTPDGAPKKWLDDARLMVDRDERDPHQARDLIRWACGDPFWRSNILSMPTFRKQFDKLRLAAERSGAKTSMVDHGRSVDEELRRRAASEQQAVSA